MVEHGGLPNVDTYDAVWSGFAFFVIAAVRALLLFREIQKKTSACAEALEDIRRDIRDIRDKGSASL